MSYLVDTNVISELCRSAPNEKVIKWFQEVPEILIFISVLTIGEIRKGIEKHPDTKRKEQIKIWLENDLSTRFKDRILMIDQGVAQRWGQLLGKINRPMPAIDSLLAATALHHEMTLVTRNAQDFLYPSLEVINPWE